MSATLQANTGTSASSWGFVRGTAVAATATVAGGAPITAWACTKCPVTGITAGAAAFGLKGAEKSERNAHAAKLAGVEREKSIRERIIKILEKAHMFRKVVVSGGTALLGVTLSSVNYYTIGKDCKVADQSGYCDTSENLFYLTSSICAVAVIFTAVLSIRNLASYTYKELYS